MPDIMLDLETLGTKPNATIISIGAVEFNIENSTLGKEFYVPINIESSLRAGTSISGDTIKWWMCQSEDACKVFQEESNHLSRALGYFTSWLTSIGPIKDIKIWGNSASFDNVILRSSYEAIDLEPPWNWRNDRCYRTIKALYPKIKLRRIGTFHNALDDAKNQAIHLMEIFDLMNLNNN